MSGVLQLELNERTVTYWINEKNYCQRTPCPPSSKLDPFKPRIIQRLETYPYSGVQVV
jgi:hypothetical protein